MDNSIEWDGGMTLSNFGGLVVKISDDGDSVTSAYDFGEGAKDIETSEIQYDEGDDVYGSVDEETGEKELLAYFSRDNDTRKFYLAGIMRFRM